MLSSPLKLKASAKGKENKDVKPSTKGKTASKKATPSQVGKSKQTALLYAQDSDDLWSVLFFFPVKEF